MRGRAWIVGAALLGAVACGPPRQRSLHLLDVGGYVYSLAFAPDGRTLACALSDRILLIDAETGTRVRELGPLPKEARPLAGSDTGIGEPWRPPTHPLLAAFSRNRLLSAGEDGYARIWDVTRGREVDRFRTGFVGSLAISPDGRWLVTSPALKGYGQGAGASEDLAVWDLDHYRRSTPTGGSPYAVLSLAVSSDGVVAVGRHEEKVDLYDAQTGKLRRTLRGTGARFEGVEAVAFSPDLPHLLAAHDSSCSVALWDVSDARLLALFQTPAGDPLGFVSPHVEALSFGMQGVLVAGDSSGVGGVWRIGGRLERVPRTIAKLSDYSGLKKLNAAGPEVSGSIDSVAVSPDGSLIATAHSAHKVRIWRGPGPR